MGRDDPVLVNFPGLTQLKLVPTHAKHHQWSAGDQECGVRGWGWGQFSVL